jgi:hypothetical protein
MTGTGFQATRGAPMRFVSSIFHALLAMGSRLGIVEYEKRILTSNSIVHQVYREGDRTLHVPTRLTPCGKGIVIHASAIVRWEPPYELEVIDQTRLEAIIANLTQGWEQNGYRVTVK